ncbi:glycosyltransferase family 1 protein [Megasphaera elsdenii]|uniref:glycosyltransferase family 1 protein n=1 Tax=Megasphaera elsdenii TaxID=907 RepID=UPI001D031A46|nr:glycosyltransferase family 1 protein [Megasphaera elsdenii]MCB5702260.1 glycosyltransferase family 1 protein [Megasphaera elsdenii]MCB5727123.1 glycosyltransferase family 1 protein [Megasphaera elsdenii]
MSKNLPIRILQVGMTKNIGGLETYLMQQFAHLDKTKVTYDFVNITSEDEIVFKDKILQAGSHIYGVRSRHSNPIRHYWQWITLLHHIAKNYKGIVLNSNSITYVFPIFIARFFGIPMRIMHSHNSGFEQRIGFAKKVIMKMNRFLLKWGATNYFACSQLAGKWMFGEKTPFTVIPNAIDCSKFCFDSEIRNEMRKSLHIEDKFVVGHVGRFTYQKNHGFLIDVFNEIHKINPKAVLLLIGDAVGNMSYYEKAKQKVQQYGLTGCVQFLGMRNDVPLLMQAMDCFVLPSRFEGLPVVGIEAQAAGLPCFFSDTITREVGLTELAHFVSLKDSSEDWAKKITVAHTVNRKEAVNQVKAAGYEIESVAQKVQDFYLT